LAPLALLESDLADRVGINNAAGSPSTTAGRSPRDDMVENAARPDVRVRPDTFAVTIDGELIEGVPATELPMAQRYFLF